MPGFREGFGRAKPLVTLPRSDSLARDPSRRLSRSYRLTPELISAHAGGPIVCLDHRAIGRRFRLHAHYPGPEINEWITAAGVDVPEGVPGCEPKPNDELTAGPPPENGVTIVRIRGVLEQRACSHPCGGYTDGHDAVAERMIAALEQGPVLMMIDSPGGAHAGLREAIARVVEVKERLGRRVIARADEMIGSAAYWWAAVVADEIYLPRDGVVGSVGARASHQSVAGALKKAGIEVTYFTYPGPGKVAYAPELPLSELGRARGIRDVTIAGTAFLKAVSKARGIPMEELKALEADALTGQEAVDAGLADGVATYDETLEYALVSAASEGDSDMPGKRKSGIQNGTTYEKRTTERYEDDGEQPKPEGEPEEPKDPNESDEGDEPEEPSDEGDEPEGEDEGDEPEGEDGDEEDEGEPEGEGPRNQPPPPQRNGRKVSARLPRLPKTLAELAGLRAGSSMPAIITALSPMIGLAQEVMRVTATASPQKALGSFRGLVEEARRGVEVESQLKDLRKQAARKERWELATKLASANVPGYEPGRVFVHRVDANGKRVRVIAPELAQLPLATFRGLVETRTEGRRAQRDPFQPASADAVRELAPKGARMSNATRATADDVKAHSTASAETIDDVAADCESKFFGGAR